MKFDHWFNIGSKQPPPGFEKIIVSSSHFLSVYVIFSLLLKIKNSLGLEAMLEYVQVYQRKFARCYPQKKALVDKEIDKINVNNMYKNAMKD